MESHEATPKQKDDQSGEDESKSMRQNMENVEESPEKNKITDLAIECLERIFKHLDFADLVNVGLSNKWLNKAANSIFKRKYGEHCVVLKSIDLFWTHRMYFDSDTLWVEAPKQSLQFLRCFGQSISKLDFQLDTDTSNQRAYLLLQYMQEYCAESLVEIIFHNGTIIPIDNQKKPFSKVEKLGCCYCDVGENFSQFNGWFPSLRHLKLIGVKVNCSTAVHFPHLEHLDIYHITDQNGDLTKGKVTDLLRHNPQLQSVSLDADWMYSHCSISLDDLVSMVSGNPLITNLTVSSPDFKRFPSDRHKLDKLGKALPALTNLCIERFEVSSAFIIDCIHQIKSLNVVKFLGLYDLDLDDDLEFDDFHENLAIIQPRASLEDTDDGYWTITLKH